MTASLRKKSETKTAPCPPGHPLGLLLAWILGWQGHESDPQGTVPLSPFSAGHSVLGTGSGTHIPSLAPLGRSPGAFLHPGETLQEGPHSLPDPPLAALSWLQVAEAGAAAATVPSSHVRQAGALAGHRVTGSVLAD